MATVAMDIEAADAADVLGADDHQLSHNGLWERVNQELMADWRIFRGAESYRVTSSEVAGSFLTTLFGTYVCPQKKV
jgi:hypothetical protein